ncbi:MAG TPA: hypothetical protein VI756_28870 [Blastocatellia bacterium]
MSGSNGHSGHEAPSGPPPKEIIEAGHEPPEVDVAAVAKFLFSLAAFGVLSFVAVWLMLKFFQHQRAENQPYVSPMASEQQHLPPPPRLQMAPGSASELSTGAGHAKAPDYEMVEQKKAETEQLNSYGWVDKNAGAVRIPIDEAMKLIVQRLPTQPGQTQTAGGGQPAPGPSSQPGIYLPTVSSSGTVAEPRKE